MSSAARLSAAGLQLPPVPAPPAADVPAVRHGDLVVVSGQLPLREGALLATGLVGTDVTQDEAAELAGLEAEAEIEAEMEIEAAEVEPVAIEKPAAPKPVAMPRMGDDDAFIPPAPRSAEVVERTAKPDPFAAAAMANGAKEMPKPAPAAAQPERPSLFERVTRTGRA
ncbi:MAG: hypothetical protein ACO3PN_09410, partial [Chthoniobacterales bacterium]